MFAISQIDGGLAWPSRIRRGCVLGGFVALSLSTTPLSADPIGDTQSKADAWIANSKKVVQARLR